ncbi:FadR/GntR family transcriptional regulator [Georgenia sp. SYP-B2076]|uniref:FadR/GntR family transcriptional regulator n=1 Tax=Georgenia sp. SYP-B2076 TaxID=2495881 RepID=UPI000F8C7075|nr:FCD domain-containing protein [Georgenia sp. SYP-B2076]
MSLELVVSRSLAAEVADRIARRIEGLEPHTRLGTKGELRKQYGVAAATLNEALQVLQADGLVTMKTGPNGGVFSAQPDPFLRIGQAMVKIRGDATTVADAIAVREALEPLAVLDASQHRTQSDLERLAQAMDGMHRTIREDLAFAHATWDFHRGIYASVRNEILKSTTLGLLELIANNVDSVRAKTVAQKIERIRVHQALVDAIESQDPRACAAASVGHANEGGHAEVIAHLLAT